jgi:protein-tyrosine phosphatase
MTTKVFKLMPNFAFGEFPHPDDVKALRADYDCLMTFSRKHPSESVKEAFEEYRYTPMPDGKTIPYEEVAHCVKIIDEWLNAGKRVLVHCYGGRNRSGLVAAEVLMKLEGISGREAMARIDAVSKKKDGSARALTNPYFRAYLEQL